MPFAAIDWAQERHRIIILDADGQVLERAWIAHHGHELGHLDYLLTVHWPADEMHVAIELHDSLLLDRLLRLGVRVYGLNPKSAQRARERFTPTCVKDDDRDAWSMAEFLRTSHQHLRPIRPHSEATLELQEWVSLREDLTQERTVHVQQLKAHLARWNPHILTVADHLNHRWVLSVLEAYPTADSFAIGHSRMMAWSAGKHLRLVARHRLADAAAAKSPTAQPTRNAAHAAEVRHRVQAIRALNERLKEIDDTLSNLIDKHPDAVIFRSLPNAGTSTIAALLAAFGEDREHWRDHEELAARWGAAPITIQSGKYQSVRRRQACDPTIHNAWLWFTFNSVRKPGCWAREVYQEKRKNGCSHYTTLRVIANRWIKITTRCWLDRRPYDEVLYRASRESRMQPRLEK